MFGYYFNLGLRSLRRNPVLTALMVLTLAVGVGRQHVDADRPARDVGRPDPAQERPPVRAAPGQRPARRLRRRATSPSDQMSLSRRGQPAAPAARACAARPCTASAPASSAAAPDLPPFLAQGVAPTQRLLRDVRGAVPATAGLERGRRRARGADVVVLSREIEREAVRQGQPGRQAHPHATAPTSTVVGVLDDVEPAAALLPPDQRHRRRFSGEDEIFIPFQTADRATRCSNSGSINCSGDGAEPGLRRASLRLGVRPGSSSGSRAESAADQPTTARTTWPPTSPSSSKLGRFPRPANVRLHNVHGVDGAPRRGQQRQQACRPGWRSASCWSAWSTRWACCWRSSRRAPARSACAARSARPARDIFRQYLIEAGVVGLAGGVARPAARASAACG